MTYQTLKDQEPEGKKKEEELHISSSNSFIASLFIALSGFILYSDKVLFFFNIEFLIPEKFQSAGMNFQTYIWLLSQTISPMLLIIGSFFRPYRISYIIPIYCYLLQLFFILMDYHIIDDHYLHWYVTGSTVLFVVLLYAVKQLRYLFIKNEFEKARKLIEYYEEN